MKYLRCVSSESCVDTRLFCALLATDDFLKRSTRGTIGPVARLNKLCVANWTMKRPRIIFTTHKPCSIVPIINDATALHPDSRCDAVIICDQRQC